MFGNPPRLIQEEHQPRAPRSQGLFRPLQQFRQSQGVLVKIADITFQIGFGLEFQQLFLKFRHLGTDPMSRLRFKSLPQLLLLGLGILLNPSDALLQALPVHNEFRRRINGDTLQLFNGALTQHVKGTNGLHLVPPQFDAVRIFFRQIIDIHDTAPNGELSAAFHLGRFLIAHVHQTPGQRRLIQGPAVLHSQNILFRVPLHLGRHQCRKGRNQRQGPALRNPPQRPHPLPGQLVAVDIRLEKDQVLGGIEKNVSIIETVFLIEFPGL